MEDKEFCENCHMLIHSLRLIKGYKPTEAEKKLSKWVLEKFSEKCKECKEVKENMKTNNDKNKTSFFDKIGEVLNYDG